MTATYRTMTTEHLGPDATEADLREFSAICEEAQRLHPDMDDAAVTDAVFGDGDYYRNARRLGVDVAATNTQTRYDAVKLVVDVLADGSRSDRYLRQAEDGHYFTTPDHTFLSNDGPHTPPSVKIPVSEDGTQEQDEEWAEALLSELDTRISGEDE